MKKILFTISSLFLIFNFVSFFIGPLYLKNEILKYVKINFGENATVENIFFNPYRLSLEIQNFNIPNSKFKNEKRLFIKELMINIDLFSLLKKEVLFEDFLLRESNVAIYLYKNGKNSWSKLKPIVLKKENEKNSNWIIRFDKLRLEKNKILYKDFNKDDIVSLPIDLLGIETENLTTQFNSNSNISNLKIKLNKVGMIEIFGKVKLNPIELDLKLKFSNVNLKSFSPYLSQKTYLNIENGYLTSNSKILFKNNAFDFFGNLKVNDLIINNYKTNKIFAKIKKIETTAVSFNSNKNLFQISNFLLEGLDFKLLLRKNGKLNFSDITKNENKSVAVKEEKKLNYLIENLKIVESTIDFEDQQIKYGFKARIQKISANVGPISSEKNNKLKLDFLGKIDSFGKFNAKGFFVQNAKPMQLDLDSHFYNLELTTFSPYSGEFAGYEIKKGKLFLDLNYQLKNNLIVGSNLIKLDQFTIGEKIKNVKTFNFPLKFLVSLLKDRQGVIKFKLPIEGQTQSAQFSYGSLIRTALYNLFINILASPFDFVASLFGKENLKNIAFEKDSDKILESDKIKINQIANMLQERPELRIDILGTCSALEHQLQTNNSENADEDFFKKTGTQRAKFVMDSLIQKGISPERLFLMAGKKNEDKIGPAGVTLILKND